jgi:hypothetical protein
MSGMHLHVSGMQMHARYVQGSAPYSVYELLSIKTPLKVALPDVQAALQCVTLAGGPHCKRHNGVLRLLRRYATTRCCRRRCCCCTAAESIHIARYMLLLLLHARYVQGSAPYSVYELLSFKPRWRCTPTNKLHCSA